MAALVHGVLPLVALAIGVAVVWYWPRRWIFSLPVGIRRFSIGAAVTLATFALVFGQSYRRHASFGSAGKDLGLFHQSIWLLSRGEAPNNTILGMSAFADHLEFIDFLVAPLMWVWPRAEALLMFQALCVAAGAFAVFDLARMRLAHVGGALCLAAAFVLAIDMQNAVMFDWNPTTCAAGILPWIAWGLWKGRVSVFALAILLCCACKENIVLYVAALCLSLALGQKGTARWIALGGMAFALVVFVVEMLWVVPHFRAAGFRHMRYEDLGHNAQEIVHTVMTRPWFALKLLWTPSGKIDGLLSPLSSVAYLPLVAPLSTLALVPSVLERFWSTHANRWWGYHYGAGAASVSSLGAMAGIESLAHRVAPERQSTFVLGLCLGVLLASIGVSFAVREGPTLLLWQQRYYTSPEARADQLAVLREIPADASVAAQNHLLPHLSARHEIFELNKPVRADYVAVNFGQSVWPFNRDYLRTLVEELLAKGYRPVACRGDAVVLGAPRLSAVTRACEALERSSL